MLPRPVRELQLATLVDTIPDGNDWLHEQKYDGYRILALREGDQIQLMSRRFNDWTDKFRAVANAIRALDATRAIIDGEVAVVLADGRTSFQALQGSFSTPNPNLVYFAFDLLAIDNEDLRALPLEIRKQRLAQLVPKPGVVHYSEHIIGNGSALFRAACARGLEGIVSKRRDRPYEPGRGTSWVKTKCTSRQELVIGGYTESASGRGGFGALLVGYYEGDRLAYAGKVGTGYTMQLLDDLGRELAAMEQPSSPFVPAPTGLGRKVHWVTPTLVAEIAFGEWTADGRLRHPVFQGLRRDKSADEVVRELGSRARTWPRVISRDR